MVYQERTAEFGDFIETIRKQKYFKKSSNISFKNTSTFTADSKKIGKETIQIQEQIQRLKKLVQQSNTLFDDKNEEIQTLAVEIKQSVEYLKKNQLKHLIPKGKETAQRKEINTHKRIQKQL